MLSSFACTYPSPRAKPKSLATLTELGCMDNLTVLAGLLIVVAFLALWYRVYDEVTQQTGMRHPRLGAEDRRWRTRFWLVFIAINALILIGWLLVG